LGTWNYVFFIDIDGHQNNDTVSEALRLLKPKVSMLKILGSYPRVPV